MARWIRRPQPLEPRSVIWSESGPEAASAGEDYERAERLVALARHRMAAKTTAQPSKPDDLSLILYRKPPAPASPRPGKDS